LANRTVIIVALVVALIAAFFAYRYVSGVKAAPAKGMVPVVVAAQDVPANVVITREMVGVKEMPSNYVHPRAINNPEQVVGKISKTDLLQGEPVLANRVTTRAQPGNRFSYRVADKQRAVTIAVSEVAGVAGFPTVGDRVDILLFKDNKTTTLLQNKEILATGDKTVSQEDGTQRIVPTVTLSLSPADAQTLAFAESTGKLKLTLRSPVDQEIVSLGQTSF
jgi:pilus assembly protein CpaB